MICSHLQLYLSLIVCGHCTQNPWNEGYSQVPKMLNIREGQKQAPLCTPAPLIVLSHTEGCCLGGQKRGWEGEGRLVTPCDRLREDPSTTLNEVCQVHESTTEQWAPADNGAVGKIKLRARELGGIIMFYWILLFVCPSLHMSVVIPSIVISA